MKIHPFQATYPHLDLIPSPDVFFSEIKNEYNHFKQSGFFSKRPADAIFIQEINTPFGIHKGIIAKNDINDFDKGKILKHENTLDAKEQSMMNFVLQTKAMVKPILLAHDEIPEVSAFINQIILEQQPILTAAFGNGEIHRFWEVNDGNGIQYLQNLFNEKIPHCYIADGHHRCSTLLKLKDNEHLKQEGISVNHILSAYFSFNNLSIFDYNRVVEIGNTSMVKIMAKLSKYCKIKVLKKGVKPTQKYHIHMYYNGTWYQLKWRNKMLQKHRSDLLVLDASLLNEYLFQRILKINDVRVDPRINYVEGVLPLREVIQPLKKDKTRLAFFLSPLDAGDLKTAAENHISLPPKSTWFEPRIKSGLLVQEF